SPSTGATIQASKTAGPGAGQYTFSVDASKVVGCGRMTGTWSVTSNNTNLHLITPDIDIRSYEVDPLQSVSDAVDRYDQQQLVAALGTNDPCSDLNRDGTVTSQDQAMLNAHLTHHANDRAFTAPLSSVISKSHFLEGLYYVEWTPGHGPASRVTLSKVIGGTETVLAANLPTTGEDPGLFGWAACDEPNAQNMTLHLLYTAGPNDGPAAVLADIQSIPFQFTGTCGFGLVSGPVIESSDAGRWRHDAALLSTGVTDAPTDALVALPGVRNSTGGRIDLRAMAPGSTGVQLGGFELFSVEHAPGEVSLVAGGDIRVGRVVDECTASLSPTVGVELRARLARESLARPKPGGE